MDTQDKKQIHKQVNSDCQPLVPSTQPLVPSTQYPVPRAQYPVPRAQYPVPRAQYPVPRAQYPVPSTQYPVPSTQYPVPSTQHPAPSNKRREIYRVINFPLKHGNCGGSLIQFQPGDEAVNALPFEIGKVLVSWDMQPDDVRGNHAHYETEEIVVALSGGCTFDLDDGKGNSASVRLTASSCWELATRHPAPRTQNPEPRAQPPEPRTQNPETKPALLLYPHIWRKFYDFEPETMLLVVANIRYDETDYIRNRAEFEECSKGWKNLGGSSAK